MGGGGGTTWFTGGAKTGAAGGDKPPQSRVLKEALSVSLTIRTGYIIKMDSVTQL